MAEKDFWKWAEVSWKSPDNEWKKANVLTAGVDVGSVSSKALIIADGKILSYATIRTRSDSSDSAHRAIAMAIDGTGIQLSDFHMIIATGYGRVNVPFAHKTITEIACHARGAHYMGGASVRTILDMGGQDCKAIHCNEKGNVTAFVMNDKCAAGTGRGMEVIADFLSVPIEEIGPLSLEIQEKSPAISSTCVIYARSEAVNLLGHGWSKASVLAAYCDAVAHRVVVLLRQVGVEKDLAITGGIAKNIGIVKRLEIELGLETVPVKPDPMIAGALGAALFAQDAVRGTRTC